MSEAPKPAGGDRIERFVQSVMVAHPNVVVDGAVRLTPEQERARKRRNILLALSIAGFVILVFVITVAKLQAGILDRPL